MSESSVKSMEAIVSLCKRRGFIYPASEIYGGINGFWDYGPLGAQLKKNLRDAWWQDMILNPCWGRQGPDNDRVRCVPVETCIIQHPKVWEASGHVGGFNDPMVDCRSCKARFRADKLFRIGASLLNYTQRDQFEEWVQTARESSDFVKKSGMILPISEGPAFRTELEYLVEADSIESVAETWSHHLAKAAKAAKQTDLGSAAKNSARTHWHAKPEGSMHILIADTSRVEGAAILIITPAGDRPGKARCPACFEESSLTEPRQFNLMFKTYVGATATEDDISYLRPETAQGIFVQFKNVVDTTRVRIPFGIGNTGRSFRNEVTPRNFTFRSREFEQAELEFFCHPDESQDWYKFWRDFRMEWWQSIGLRGDNLILREHDKDELSHYSTGTSDVEYRFPFTAPGFGELEGIAHRGCFDLTQHQEHSGAKLDYFDTELQSRLQAEGLPKDEINKRSRYLPHVIEPAAGLDRGALALICEAYTVDDSRPSPEIMRFHPRMAPIKAAVFPLVNKDGMPEVAEKLHAELFKRFGQSGFIETDAKQSIGKRYARMDEAGCPYCFTIDGQTLTDQTVTVRDRDTGSQERIALDAVKTYLEQRLGV